MCVCVFSCFSAQEVISALRGTGQEVTLLLCRPERGVLPEMDTSALVSQLITFYLFIFSESSAFNCWKMSSQTPMASPRKELVSLVEPRTTSPAGTQSKKIQGSVEEALERLHIKTPGRHNSYSDSTDGDEEVEEAFSASTAEHNRQIWERSVYHTPSSNLGLGRYDSTGHLDDTIHSAFYSPNLSMTRMDLSKRYSMNPVVMWPYIKANATVAVFLKRNKRIKSFTKSAVCIY